ncbi:MAG TPA: hypothetical protein VHS08_06400, partial [Candidatus Acidoferrales bacterium]|nr:hypothetical protein [Candidatus Acidoferrales bacterium]
GSVSEFPGSPGCVQGIRIWAREIGLSRIGFSLSGFNFVAAEEFKSRQAEAYPTKGALQKFT